jgi:diguanylate cyclase (GGDEF)-like protein/PAS domain S-box-containing protein
MLRSIRSQMLGLVLASVVPFMTLIGVGLWSQWHEDQNAAIRLAINEARLLAAQLDDHIGNLENLLAGLSRAVSTNPADVSANDALLRQARAELPDFIGNIVLSSLDGTNIGTSREGEHVSVGDRIYFRQVLGGQRLAVGEVVPGRVTGQFVVNIGRSVEDQGGQLRAVLSIATLLEHFQDALRIQGLPPGSVVRIVNEHAIVVAQSVNGPNWIGRDLKNSEQVARHLALKEASEVYVWSDNVERITGSSTAHRVPWLVSVGLPSDIAFAGVAARLHLSALFSVAALVAVFAIAWMFSGRIVRPLQQLGKDASVLAAGGLSHRTAVRAPHEVGDLADAFNRMAVSLERRQEETRRATDDVRQAKDMLSAVIDASPVAIVCSDLDRRIMLWSQVAEQLYGYTAEEAIGVAVKMVPPEGSAESFALFQRALNGETIREVQVKRVRKDGSTVDVRVAAAPMYNLDGTVRGVAWAHEDITDRKRAEAQLHRLAHYDPLTGLPNRLSLQKELGRSLCGDCRGRSTSVALFDLDGFKDVNDTLGHSIGDQLLVEVGQRLIEVSESRGEMSRVCRLGGDEFVVVVPDCGDPLVIGEIVDRILKRLAEPFKINDHSLHLSGSAGIAIAPNDGSTVDELIANADLALYQAKSEGGRTYRFFLSILRAQAQARRALDLELRRAFAEHEFELYFQPQIRLADHAVVGAEALLRWRHPVRGILSPGTFIETLAGSSIAPAVSSWIIRTACEKTSAWRAMGLPLGRIGVNVFPNELHQERLLQDIDDALRESGLRAECLELEITENVALNYSEATTMLQKLREKGVNLAFDDFGTGYASLSSLTRFPLSRIKIDRSFVGRITDDAEDAAIVRSLIGMAHNLGLAVIAEGVETSSQAAFLLNEQCEEAQGFLFAEPLPAAQFEAYLRTRHLAAAAEGSIDKRPNHNRNDRRRATSSSNRRKFPRA